MHRPTIGAITVGLFGIGLALWCLEPSRDSTFALACFRVGIVMAVLWLALPQLVLLPRWIGLTLVGAVAIVSWRPEALLIALPILVVLAIIRPRWGRPPSGRPE